MPEDLFEKAFPNIHYWVISHGWVEVGQDDCSKSLVRAIDAGGVVWESARKHKSVDKALQALEIFLEKWFEENI